MDLQVLSAFGGKITTYRRLAEHALDELRPSCRDGRGLDRRTCRCPAEIFPAAISRRSC